jgi:TolA-binding protein
MRKGLFILIVFLDLALAGCSGDNAAEQLFETAKLEMLQDNREHAKKLYEEIIRTYPESPYAKEARASLSALEAGR